MNTYNTFRNGGRFATLLGWDPMRLIDDLVTWPMGSEVVWSAYPSPVHATQDEDRATITIDMPGVDEQDLDLTYEAGQLAIVGKRGERTYRYTVTLGDSIDPDRIEAQLRNGVLTVRAEKRPEAKPRKILVSGASQKALGRGEST